MNKARLRHLVEVLENIPDPVQTFDMKYWTNYNFAECRTTCCALGYAALDPEFRAQGLQLRENHSKTIVSEFADIGKTVLNKGIVEPIFGENFTRKSFGYFAAEEFFEIDELTAHFIFSPYGYRENFNRESLIIVQEVISHINYVLIHGDAPHAFKATHAPIRL